MSDLETLLNELEKLDEYNKSQPASYRMAPDNDKLSSLIKATRVIREALEKIKVIPSENALTLAYYAVEGLNKADRIARGE